MLGKKGANQYTYGAEMLSSTKEKISQATKTYNESRWSIPENRAKHSAAMKRAVAINPAAYSSSNRGRTKQQIINGVKCQGQWEDDFYTWALAQGLTPTRVEQGFPYIWNGREHTYFPDFYIETLNVYVEVKGYETERDRAKWLHFPHKLCIIKAREIKEIRKNLFRAGSLVS